LFDLYKDNKLTEVSSTLKFINGHDLHLNIKPAKNEAVIKRVMKDVWKIANCYRLVNEQKMDETSIWYVMDELGSSI